MDVVASVIDAENHFQGRIAEKMNSGKFGVCLGAMIDTKTTYTSIWRSGSRTHQMFPSRVSAPRLWMSAWTR
jgi:hypothetical protein